MNEAGQAIQIEQRQSRCGRCGKMINLRGFHLRETLPDGSEILFCSTLCRDEYEALFGLTDGGAAAPGESA